MASRSDGARPRARKRFGQHFLEPAWARKVVDAVHPQANETFLEIGPGTGAITGLLAERARAVVASEIDRDLAARLGEGRQPGVLIVEGDFLDLSLDTLRAALAAAAAHAESKAMAPADPASAAIRVVGNLPYNVASPIMFRLVELSRGGLPIADATVMLQREVADRLLARAGTADYGLLTVLIGHRTSVTRLLDLPPGAFRPAPKVRSTVVRLRFHDADPPVLDEAVLAGVVSAAFSRRRKTLSNALPAFGNLTPVLARRVLESAGIDPARRGETLAIAEFARLADAARQVMAAL
jgi:16S rRNA (adenine1518-N6/adenine1519-N6)-dimethyltransferase